eukprot:gene37510-19242_t
MWPHVSAPSRWRVPNAEWEMGTFSRRRAWPAGWGPGGTLGEQQQVRAAKESSNGGALPLSPAPWGGARGTVRAPSLDARVRARGPPQVGGRHLGILNRPPQRAASNAKEVKVGASRSPGHLVVQLLPMVLPDGRRVYSTLLLNIFDGAEQWAVSLVKAYPSPRCCVLCDKSMDEWLAVALADNTHTLLREARREETTIDKRDIETDPHGVEVRGVWAMHNAGRDLVDGRLRALARYPRQMGFGRWPWGGGRSTHARNRHLMRIAPPLLVGLGIPDAVIHVY